MAAAGPRATKIQPQDGHASGFERPCQAPGPGPLAAAPQAMKHNHQRRSWPAGRFMQRADQAIAATDIDLLKAGGDRGMARLPQHVPQGLEIRPQPGGALAEGGEAELVGETGHGVAGKARRAGQPPSLDSHLLTATTRLGGRRLPVRPLLFADLSLVYASFWGWHVSGMFLGCSF